jgi:hypothetical protein
MDENLSLGAQLDRSPDPLSMANGQTNSTIVMSDASGSHPQKMG